MSTITADTLHAHSELSFGYMSITAAQLAVDGGLITIPVRDPAAGCFLDIEPGAIVKGIRVLGEDGEHDETASYTDRVRMLTIACLPGAPGTISVVNESLDVDPEHRLRVQSTTPDTTADGTITHNPTIITWRPGTGRWTVPWSAP
jgi:hypothetical protein